MDNSHRLVIRVYQNVLMMNLMAIQHLILAYCHRNRRASRDGRGRHNRHRTRSYRKRFNVKSSIQMSLAAPVIIQHLSVRRADVFYDLYKECEPWLRLPLWLSENVYNSAEFRVTTLQVAQQAALLHRAGNTGGRSREASTSIDIFGITWNFLRARSGRGASESAAASPQSAHSAVRHGVWAIIQALTNKGVVKWPTTQEMVELVTSLPPSLQQAMGPDSYWWGSMDGTLIKLEPPAVANELDRQSYWCSKKAHNQARCVGNSIANLFVADWQGRLRGIDISRPGSMHDVRHLKLSHLMPKIARQPLGFKIVADQGFRATGSVCRP